MTETQHLPEKVPCGLRLSAGLAPQPLLGPARKLLLSTKQSSKDALGQLHRSTAGSSVKEIRVTRQGPSPSLSRPLTILTGNVVTTEEKLSAVRKCVSLCVGILRRWGAETTAKSKTKQNQFAKIYIFCFTSSAFFF